MKQFLKRCVNAVAMAALVLCGSSVAQENERVGASYVPSDATATAVLTVADTLQSEAAKLYPVEILNAWTEQNLGIAATDIASVKLVVGVPGPGEPLVSVIHRLNADFDLSQVSPKIVDTNNPETLGDYEVYRVVDTPMVLYVKDPRTVIASSRSYLETVVRAAENEGSEGALARLASNVPHTGTLTVVFAVEPVRPMINGVVQMSADQIPPPLQPYTKIPDLLEAILLRIDLENPDNSYQMVMLANDESSADQLSQMIADGMGMGRQMFLANALSEVEGDDAVAEATRSYLRRVSEEFVKMLTPKQDGRRLVMNGKGTNAIASQGVLIGLLLPAVQSARQAARRMSSSNNLKQIGLAVHNYHSAYARMPGDIKAEDGTPLLSWRVAILPFMEEQVLWEQFNKDEPWDSPNNLPLAERMPQVYVHPGVPTPPNKTVYQRPIGESYPSPTKELRFRDMLDGLSNTILALETPAEKAVAWSKPGDITLPADQPLQPVISDSRQGFHVLMADGAVIFIANTIDGELFKKLLTHQGREVIEGNFR